jgi:hypothetical protein
MYSVSVDANQVFIENVTSVEPKCLPVSCTTKIARLTLSQERVSYSLDMGTKEEHRH